MITISKNEKIIIPEQPDKAYTKTSTIDIEEISILSDSEIEDIVKIWERKIDNEIIRNNDDLSYLNEECKKNNLTDFQRLCVKIDYASFQDFYDPLIETVIHYINNLTVQFIFKVNQFIEDETNICECVGILNNRDINTEYGYSFYNTINGQEYVIWICELE